MELPSHQIDNVKGLIVKPLSATRWKSRVKSVKPIRFQLSDVREALLEVRDTGGDPKTTSDANSLKKNEFSDFEFIVSIIIWYEVLLNVNVVSQKLQSEDMIIDDAIDQVKKLINYFKKYREVGLSKVINEAKEITIEFSVDPIFNQRRLIRRKKTIWETSIGEDALFLAKEDFRLRELGEKDLKSRCYCLQDALKNGEESDIDAEELYGELKLFETFLPSDGISPLDVLNNLKQVHLY
ncbi:uncharacterized protein LOC143546747 [Bidens hawaiensis]|uniref:uncharacterized protein LOC143546747 n=1 Tax=Bidens hawaiensis TaxID=980011 RepID=UPI00404AA2EA